MITIAFVTALSSIALAQETNNPRSFLQIAPGGNFLSSEMSITQSMAGMDLMSSTPALFGSQKKKVDYNFFEYHPNSFAWGPIDGVFPDPTGYMFSPIRNLEVASQEQLGLRWDIYNVTAYQMATKISPRFNSNEGVNRFNLRCDLKLWDFGGGAVGRITAQMRETTTFSGHSELGIAMGSEITLDGNFTSLLGTRLVRFRYEQGILDNRVMFTVGKINPNDYFLNNPFAGDETSQFLASIFDGSDAAQSGFQGYMLGAGVLTIPVEGVYANFLATAPSSAQYKGIGAEGLDTGLWWAGTEVGIVTDLFRNKDIPGKYGIGFSTTNASFNSTNLATSQRGDAFWLIGTQYVTPDIGAWAEFTYCDPDVALYKTEFTAGISIDNCFGRKHDGFGVGWGYTTNPQSDLGIQTVTEIYYRFQMTNSIQITPDLQVITNPTDPLTNTNAGTTNFVFGVRMMMRF